MSVLSDLRAGRAQKLFSAATAATALPMGVEIYINHYGGSFGNKWMWTPVVLSPALSAAGVAGVARLRVVRCSMRFWWCGRWTMRFT